jgi:hypothetical protein
LKDRETVKMIKEMDLNEQDIEDLKEIRTLEKIASIKESQGIKEKDEHKQFIKDSAQLVEETLGTKKEGGSQKNRP